ncbi:MAG TPA: pectin acetylesterase-family hydrolase [Candidatus Binatia bacterium]|nr:pectin acetylesterase-family hydrolase [Candidatus Binatia bacterium]
MACPRRLVAVLVVVFGGAGLADAKRAKPPSCPAGRFLVSPASEPLLPGISPAIDAITIDGAGHVSLDGCGAAGRDAVKARRRFTAIKARWHRCGAFAQVALSAKVAAPGCDAMAGSLRARKTRRKVFSAERSLCGDGRLDTVGGEQCDASAAGGDQACPGACGAPGTSSACRCPTGPATPIVAPLGQWTWVDFPDATCDDGSPTGIGVNLTSGPNVLVFLDGGGACWDYTTCYVLNTATHGPFGKAQFDARTGGTAGSILDRQLAGNPFADWSLVFVPYCTGDVHAGDNVIVYQNGATSRTYHHTGHANVLAYLRRLAPTFPSPEKLVVSGASAGGFGALANYADFRAHWPSAAVYLLDDSGPPLESTAYSGALHDAWVASWRLDEVLDPLCGTACLADFSLALPALAMRYPHDRLALLESEQDGVIRTFYGLSATAFETALLTMAADRLDPTATFHYFFITGSTHTMLGSPAGFSQNGVPLLAWVTQLVDDDPAWGSIKP